MKILITGGAGFIGSHLVYKLLDQGHKVSIIDDLSGGSRKNLPAGVQLWAFDCRDPKIVDEVFSIEKPDVVFHLAANAAENKAQFSPIDVTSRNWNAFINVLTPAIKYHVKRFVFTSSIAVYGALQTPFKEHDKPQPEDLYGITKLACEQALKVMSDVHGFEYVIARPHNVYGVRQNMQDPYRNVVTIWMNSILKGEPYYIYGDGEQKRCFSYIEDVIDGLYRCGFDPDVNGFTFNLGADKTYTLNELSKVIDKVTGNTKPAIHLADRPQEVKEAIADHASAKALLFYEDRTSLEEGIAKTWEWVKEQGYQQPIYGGIEIPSAKIPVNWKL